MTFEDELRRALRRREPPEGFADRTLARVRADVRAPAARGFARDRRRRQVSAWIAAAVAASMLVAAGTRQFAARRHDAVARRAADELTLALRITSEKLNDVQVKVRTTGQSLGSRHDNQFR